eukprot:2086151-Pyramimonas_sp.AAC.1
MPRRHGRGATAFCFGGNGMILIQTSTIYKYGDAFAVDEAAIAMLAASKQGLFLTVARAEAQMRRSKMQGGACATSPLALYQC